jgi:hypothetical protein
MSKMEDATLGEPAQAVPTLKVLAFDEFVQRPNVSSHVRGVIPARGIVVVFGPPKCGKTFSVCDLTMHAAYGLDWHGYSIRRPMRVVYLAGEGVDGLRIRLKAWQEHHDSTAEAPNFWVLPLALSLPGRVRELAESLRPLQPDIVVADTLNTFFGGGDENSTQDMTKWCDSVRHLRDVLGCSVVIVHHTGHRDSTRERGSIVLRSTADVMIQVAKDKSDGDRVGFQVISARDIEPMDTPISLHLVRHETEWKDEDGNPLVSCIVQAGDRPVTLAGSRQKGLGKAQSQILRAAQELAAEMAPHSNDDVILARSEIARRATTTNSKLTRQSIHSAWPALAQRGHLRLVEPDSIALKARV